MGLFERAKNVILIMHEDVSKKGGDNKYTVVLAKRFIVSASGYGVDIGTLKSAVGSIDLRAIEALK